MINLENAIQKWEEELEKGLELSNSALSIWEECRFKFFLSRILRLKTRHTPDYFIAGTAWDKIIPLIYQEKPLDEIKDKIDEIYEPHLSEGTLFDPLRGPDNLKELVTRFRQEKYHIKTSPVGYTKIEHHLSFKIPIYLWYSRPEPRFYLCGELDTLFHIGDTAITLQDNKTTKMTVGSGKMWSQYLDSFSFGSYGNQMRTYIYALSLLHPEPIYHARAMIASLNIPKRATTERTLFTIEYVTFNPKETLRIISQRCSLANQEIRDATKHNIFPACGHRCTGGFGMSACEFWQICQITQDEEKVKNNLSFLEQDYVQWEKKEWEGEQDRREGEEK